MAGSPPQLCRASCARRGSRGGSNGRIQPKARDQAGSLRWLKAAVVVVAASGMHVSCKWPATIMQRCHASLMPSSCKIPSKYHARPWLEACAGWKPALAESRSNNNSNNNALGTVSRRPQVRAVAPHAAVQPLLAAARGDAAQARTARAPARRNRASVAVGHGSAG